MSHLDPERLAALADDEPAADERTHLTACPECARELAAHRALLDLAAAERGRIAQPLTSWEALVGPLRDEGLLRQRGTVTRSPAARRPWMPAAAAALFLAVGVVGGRLCVQPPAATPAETNSAAATSPATNTENGGQNSGARLASNIEGEGLDLAFPSADSAMRTLRRAERDYRLAAAFLTTLDTAGNDAATPARYRVRLAALDKMSDAALEAVNQAPHDPVINQYYLSAVSARQVTLHQLGRALSPAGVRLVGY